MLVGFVGIPASGKTTIAAEVFAGLKRMGTPSEFVVEVARQAISELRKMSSDPVVLTDDIQKSFMLDQFKIEQKMNDSGVVCISDSSPLNALLYMENPEYGEFFKKVLDSYDYLVVVQSEDKSHSSQRDPNRVHGPESRARLTAALQVLTKQITEQAPSHLTVISGPWINLQNEDLSTRLCWTFSERFWETSK